MKKLISTLTVTALITVFGSGLFQPLHTYAFSDEGSHTEIILNQSPTVLDRGQGPNGRPPKAGAIYLTPKQARCVIATYSAIGALVISGGSAWWTGPWAIISGCLI
ncbi:hypothetical protein [Culicoidibacter larvae]|uniref:Uncharacterized protein n=1 Tax=Culicoidibacter larvae TaxID=2579976 RepID=A0A5R8QHF8_9FIRM|nr:hypothetical protein [Culicoidibacter larvae]TLG77392.1 hypothetical protein FEZ08_01875 [Culicoidibacter larvae]